MLIKTQRADEQEKRIRNDTVKKGLIAGKTYLSVGSCGDRKG
jgi:hypothetical protein